MFSICGHKKMHLFLRLMCTKNELICPHGRSFMAQVSLFESTCSTSLIQFPWLRTTFKSPQYVGNYQNSEWRFESVSWIGRDVRTLFDVVADTSASPADVSVNTVCWVLNKLQLTNRLRHTFSVGPETVTVSATWQLCLRHWRTRPRTLNVSGGGVLPHLLNQSTAV
jgi:hypothetical protein